MKDFGGLQINVKKSKSVKDTFRNTTGQKERIELISFKDLEINDNPYPISELEDLIISIKQFGLEQNLVVKEQDNEKYLIISGHRRYFAVKYILDNDKNNEFEELNHVYCKVMAKDVDELIARMRIHETNLNVRPLLKMKEEEKLEIIEDYLNILAEARKRGLKINGKEIKGKTRNLIAEAFNISPTQAGREISKVKNKGVQMDTTPKKKKSASDELNKILEKLTKIEYENTEEEIELKKKIINLLSK